MPSQTFRKKVRHDNTPGHLHNLTFSCYDRKPLLTNDQWRILLSRSIDEAVAAYAFHLVAFVYMPEHVHLLVHARSIKADIASLLKAIKQPFSHQVKRQLVNSNKRLLDQLTIRERPGKTTFRFWQEGGGYDRNLTDTKSILTVIDYLHLNPVRRGLVIESQSYRWSSYHHYQDVRHVDEVLPTIHGLPPEIG